MHIEDFVDPFSRFLALARSTPDAPLCTWIDDDGLDGETISRERLRIEAGSVAAALCDRGRLEVGDRVLIVMPPGLDFMRAFCGCLMGNLIPVPVYPHAGADRLCRIAANSGIRAVLTDAMTLRARRDGPATAEWPAGEWYDTSALVAERGPAPAWRPPRPEDTAFLQYTSGSTSEPKGVCITHGNLAHQLHTNRRELGLGPQARAVLWVPQYHDLGLISGLVSALIGNGRLYQMSPLTFLKRPSVWLEVASRVRATHIAGPNFGYELVLKRTKSEEIGLLSLSSLQMVMSAAEPINPRSMRAFFDAFGVAGLRREAVCGAYGMAEHTVGVSVFGQTSVVADERALEQRIVTETSRGRGVEIHSCGRPSAGVAVRIVDPDSFVPLAEDRVGEIWVDSPSKAAGYHGMPDLTEELFHARTKDAADTHEYLRTGDMGFLHKGELFVTGRLKEMMIFRGRNLYPADVEMTAESAHPALRSRGVVVFSVPNHKGEESLVVVAEAGAASSPTAYDDIITAISKAVSRRHGQPCSAVVLVKPHTIPKTTSGKLRRLDARQAFLNGDFARPSVLVRMTSAPATPPAAAAAPLSIPGPDTLDDSMRRLFARFVNVFSSVDHSKDGPMPAVTASGTMRILAPGTIPWHRFFSRAATYPVLLRHTNTNREADDAVITGRGAAIRVLDPEKPADFHRTLLDIVTMTGRVGLVRDAAAYVQWFVGDQEARKRLNEAHPSIKEYFLDFWRDPLSFTAMHYHSQEAFHFLPVDGSRHFVRYRLVEANVGRDTGQIPIDSTTPYLNGHVERRTDDVRSRDYLRQEFEQRVASGSVIYRLAIQLQVEPAARSGRDDLLDATLEWNGPWIDVAEITLDAIVPAAVASPLAFNIGNAPRDLAVVLARNAHDPASIGHLRAIVYDLSGRLRRRETLPPEYAAFLWKKSPATGGTRKRVCVLGAGPSGLTAAYTLERLGHEVTVFERSETVGGMAASVMLDGKPYDLGAHLCTGTYETIANLARELNVETEATTGYYLYELKSRSVIPQDHSIFRRDAYEHYQQCRHRFPEIDRPGLQHSAATLSLPVSQWIESNRLGALAASMGANYTAAGYGYLDDPTLSAIYLLKFSEMIGALSSRPRLSESWTFTIRNGFQTLWRRVQETLRDVRCGVAIDCVERDQHGVTVKRGNERWTFDDVVIAIPPRDALRVLDGDLEERQLFECAQTFDYVTTVVRAGGLPESGLYLLKENCASRARIGHTVAYHHRYAGSDIYLFYAYGNGMDDRALDAALEEDIAAMGGTIKNIMSRRRFSYMPHPTADAIGAGYFDRMEDRQGQRHTYYTGSVLGFELVECVAAHSQAMVQRYFGGPRTMQRHGAAAIVEERNADRWDVATIETWLAREIAAELDLKDPIPRDAELAIYQIDSVTAAAILGSLSQWLGWAVPPYIIFDQPAIASIAAAVAGARPAAPSAKALPGTGRLIALNSPETSPPIFLMGGLMGASLYLRELAESLPMHQPVFALQAAGLDGKEPPFGSVKAAADAYLTAIRGARPRGPYRLAGHSFGGLVAYETACRLRDRGEAVHLVLLDTLLFGEGEPSELPDENVALAELLIAIHVQQRPDIIPNAAAVAATPSNVMRDQVISALAGSRPFAAEVTLSRWLPVYRAHSSAMREYRAEPARDLRWTLLKAEEGFPSAMMHPKRVRYACYDQPLLGWEGLSVPPAVKTVPGNHYTMVLGKNSIATARAMVQYFDD